MTPRDEPQEGRAKTVRGSGQHNTAILLVFALAVSIWAVIGTLVGTGHIEPLVAILATTWFVACIASGLFFPPRHGRPLSEYNTSEAHTPAVNGQPTVLFSTQVSPMCIPRVVYGLLSFLQTQCAIFVLGSLIYGVGLMSSGKPSIDTDKAVITGILLIASVIGVLGGIWSSGIEKLVIVAQSLSLFVPIATTRDAAMVLHVETGLAIGMTVVALAIGWIIGRDYYVRSLCLVSFAAAGALVCITTSWDNLVDPASEGPYVLVCFNLAIWAMMSLVMTSRTRRGTVVAILMVGIALSLVVSLTLGAQHLTMPTWGATLALALIFITWVAVYDLVQYNVLLEAYIMSQGDDYKLTASGHYFIAVLMMNRYTSWG